MVWRKSGILKVNLCRNSALIPELLKRTWTAKIAVVEDDCDVFLTIKGTSHVAIHPRCFFVCETNNEENNIFWTNQSYHVQQENLQRSTSNNALKYNS